MNAPSQINRASFDSWLDGQPLPPSPPGPFVGSLAGSDLAFHLSGGIGSGIIPGRPPMFSPTRPHMKIIVGPSTMIDIPPLSYNKEAPPFSIIRNLLLRWNSEVALAGQILGPTPSQEILKEIALARQLAHTPLPGFLAWHQMLSR